MKLAKLHDKPEIFYTIQGEGKNLGRPSVFVRLSLCNLYCVWCDTDYTWNWKNTKYPHLNDRLPDYSKYSKEDYILEVDVQKIVDEIIVHDCKNIVLTGGEPLVQHKELSHLLEELKQIDSKYFFEIETNGTIIPNADFQSLIDQYNVSVKLSNSGVKRKDRIVDRAFAFFSQSEKSNFKFVVDTQKDIEEVLELKNNFNIDSESIYLMPQGRNAGTLKAKQQWIFELCMEHKFNYTDRMHVHIYGDKRGV